MWQLISFLKYLYASKGPNRVHSPFVFELYTEAILPNKNFYRTEALDKLREELLNDHAVITQENPGAGSKKLNRYSTTVASVAKISGSPLKYSRLLLRLADRFKPAATLELGTSLGIATMHLAAAHPLGKVITLEGNPETAAFARKNFKKAGLTNVELIEGLFSETLPSALQKLTKLDLVFLDGDHRKEPALNYIRQMLPHFHNDSLLIMDDIHWSKEMEEAWEEVKQLPEVTVTIDLYRMGLVFFRKEQVREHFILRF